jgi:tRNA(Ile)-lysidine synthase
MEEPRCAADEAERAGGGTAPAIEEPRCAADEAERAGGGAASAIEEPNAIGSQLLERCSFPDGRSVVCAVSGGQDSLALMVLAVWSGLDVCAVHVDHGLRRGSRAEAAVVAAAAERFGARFESRVAQVVPGPNLEARARDARYAVLPDEVLVGHTADDQAETLLLNLTRGAGAAGLAAMRHDRRPLLRLRRSETAALCESLDLRVVRDPTNDDPAFRRNRIRHEVIPLLCDVAGRDVVPILARAADHQRELSDLLDDLAAGIDPTDGRSVAALPPAIAGQVVRRWHRDAIGASHPPDRATVGRVLEVARGEVRGAEVGDGWRVERTDGRLRMVRPESSPARDDR